MRIAFVYDAVYPWVKGGAQKRLYEIGRRLVKRGYEVNWFSLKWWDGKKTIERDGIYIYGVGEGVPLYKYGKRSIYEAIYFARKLLRVLPKYEYDVIDCQEFPYFSCFSSKVTSFLRSIPMIITWHEVWGDYWYSYLGKKGFFGKIIEKLVTKLTSNNVAVSKKTKEDLESIGVKNVQIIPNGIDFYKIQKIKPSEEEYDLIFVGRLIKEKNVDILIKAVSLLKEEIPDIKAVIIGEGPERQKLEMLVQKLKIEKNIEFKGFLNSHEDVIAHMKSSKVFVFPTIREGFGIVVLEANASGIPVVTTNHPMNAAKDLITEGKNGFLAKLDPIDFSEKISFVLHGAKNMKKSALHVASKYDWDQIVQKYTEYLKIISSGEV
ncbi:glycosyltransferase family 4 protein [Pyrococcus kukulkanii]|uniref:glycosyltransferase family 4 protein n=1 Tax=Pyrococcus kukulkanii TaxID=1609559 RepID=UPI0035694E6D